MRIFLSHRSRDKALVQEFRSLLPRFLDTWLDDSGAALAVGRPLSLVVSRTRPWPAIESKSKQRLVDRLLEIGDFPTGRCGWREKSLDLCLTVVPTSHHRCRVRIESSQ